MSKKNRPPNGHPAPSGVSETTVLQFIAHGKYKAAVESAKEFHKAHNTAASESLLVDAYAVRIQAFFDQNMPLEARSLLDLVRQRYPSARARLQERNGSLGLQEARLGELLRPLADAELSPERRAEIEAAVAEETDLKALAECATLPEDHPLRRAATALHGAFLAVTSGAVTDEAVELSEVSRRSPLAPWKLLVRAIACFYRQDDEACRRHLDAINQQSAPARLVPAIRAMLDGGNPAGLTEAGVTLVSTIAADNTAPRQSLELLERALHAGNKSNVLAAIRDAVKAWSAAQPAQLEELKAQIAIRCSHLELTVQQVQKAMGGPGTRSANFLRMMALSLEGGGDEITAARACHTWDEFRRAALQEGWFPEKGPETAILYVHMAGLLKDVPAEVLSELIREGGRAERKPPEAFYYLSPRMLYQRAAALDPHSETFSQWLHWEKQQNRGTPAGVAESWHKIHPEEIEPILFLLREKERRKTYSAAMKYLAKAERINSVHPDVRRAGLRIRIGAAIRSLEKKTPEIALRHLEEASALPQAQQGDMPAVVAIMRALCVSLLGDYGRAESYGADAERILGSKAAAEYLDFILARECKLPEPEFPVIGRHHPEEKANIPELLVRLSRLSDDLNVPLPLVPDWQEQAEKEFHKRPHSFDFGHLEVLGNLALTANRLGFCYAISAEGLTRGEATEANFLLYRARVLSPEADRWAACAAAAAQLARERRQPRIPQEAAELLSHTRFYDLDLDSDEAHSVLRQEKLAVTAPTKGKPGPSYDEIFDGPMPDDDEEDPFLPDWLDDEDQDEDEVEALMNMLPIPPDLPRSMAREIVQEMMNAAHRGESFESVSRRLFGAVPTGGQKKKAKKGTKKR